MLIAAMGLISSSYVAIARLTDYVDCLLVERAAVVVEFVDLPEQLARLAKGDLQGSIAPLIDRPWTNDRLCRDIAARLSHCGWVGQVHRVRQCGLGRFEASCRYRVPVAMVQQDSEFYLVDKRGVRLPGIYHYDPSWHIIQGVSELPPAPGEVWEGDDLRSGLTVIEKVETQPFAGQITAVLVSNFGGRTDPRRSHLELATDQAGGRIRWGSAPGSELEENTMGQKLAILQENFQRTGRVDAHHPVIDVSTFPDRFTIPG